MRAVVLVVLPIHTEVAVVPPMPKPPLMESMKGVLTRVFTWPVPVMRKSAVWSAADWFWM